MNTGQIRNNKNMKDSRKNSAAALGMVCWIVYFSIYLGRLNFSASMGEMTRTGLWGKTELGSVAAAFYLAYGLAQIPCGILGDKISPKKLVFIGLLRDYSSQFIISVCGQRYRDADPVVFEWCIPGHDLAAGGKDGDKSDLRTAVGEHYLNVVIYSSGGNAGGISSGCSYAEGGELEILFLECRNLARSSCPVVADSNSDH